MALYKELKLKSGITVSHWVILGFSADRENKKFNILISPYISKKAMDDGNLPIDSEKIGVRIEDLEYPAGMEWRNSLHYTKYFSPDALDGKNVYEVMYNYLKENIEFFKDAVDI